MICCSARASSAGVGDRACPTSSDVISVGRRRSALASRAVSLWPKGNFRSGSMLLVVELARVYLDQIVGLSEKVAGLEKAIACEAKRGAMTRRLQTMPGVGPITAMAIETFAPPMEVFRRGRDFAAWLGLVPVQHSTGGKQVLGKTSKMGQRDIRRLLITGAMVIVRWACRKGAQEGTWLHRMLGRKPRMLVAIALANKMARSIWAMLTKEEDYRGPVAATV
jgi:transposase